ncbi:MAG: MnhB domain-containing protein [Candidatus Omnitrophica bacterium]|nr:MnhB domain-containing protein [Candidatus Omnitrophota bacterium]
MDNNAGMSLIVKTVTRILVGFILLYGIYIVLHGHISPGGGFAGGFIIALTYILFMLAFGKEEILKRVPQSRIPLLESIGALMFLTIAVLGFFGGYFFANWLPKGISFKLFSAGTIPISNIALAMLEVSLGLFGIFLVLVLLKFTPSKNGGKEN